MNIDELKIHITGLKGQWYEIAGPTPGGYSFLNKLKIVLPVKPVVSNVSQIVTHDPYGPNPTAHRVEKIIDCKHMPMAKNSVDGLIVCYLPLHSSKSNSYKLKRARKAYGYSARFAFLARRYNLHIAFLYEAARVLRPGGILIMEGAAAEDKLVGKRLGLKSALSDDSDRNQIFIKQS